MPHLPSPHRLPSASLSGGLATFHLSKALFGAPIPLHPQIPLSSPPPKQSIVASNMAATFQEPAPSRDQRAAFVDFNDADSMQWEPHSNLPMNYMRHDGPGYLLPLQFMPESATLCDYGQGTMPCDENYELTYATQPRPSCPQSYADTFDLTGLPTRAPDSHPPAAYQIEPQGSLHEIIDLADQSINGQLMQLREEYDNCSTNIKQEEYFGYLSTSLYDSDITRCSTPNIESAMRPHVFKTEGGDESAIDKEQPYAQLIHRALLGAPGHTMILRDIYDWFRDNTDKAADKETKGWQNSIRHNLSMNGAFEKVDLPGEESKRGFMWRLTEQALREGVKSTTRYRTKQPNKRSHRSQHPLPQRQASGARGGEASKRSARSRKANRMNKASRSESLMHTSRSVPPAYESFAADISMPSYPSSPYYGPIDRDFDFDYVGDNISSPLRGSNMELLNTQSRNGSPLSQSMSTCRNSAYIHLSLDPSEPLFTDSPSPPGDEPRTPATQETRCDEDLSLAGGCAYVFDTPYCEYPM